MTPLSIWSGFSVAKYSSFPKVRPVQNLSSLNLQTDELGNGKNTNPPPPPPSCYRSQEAQCAYRRIDVFSIKNEPLNSPGPDQNRSETNSEFDSKLDQNASNNTLVNYLCWPAITVFPLTFRMPLSRVWSWSVWSTWSPLIENKQKNKYCLSL